MVIVERRVELLLGARQRAGYCREVTRRIRVKASRGSGSWEEDQITRAARLKGVV